MYFYNLFSCRNKSNKFLALKPSPLSLASVAENIGAVYSLLILDYMLKEIFRNITLNVSLYYRYYFGEAQSKITYKAEFIEENRFFFFLSVCMCVLVCLNLFVCVGGGVF